MSAVTAALAVVGLVVMSIAAVAIVQRPQRGILLLALLVPFDGLLIIVPHPGAAEGWKEGLVVFTLLATFLSPPSSRGPDGRRLPDWLPAFAALLATGLASAAFVGGTQAIVGLKINYFYALVALVLWRCPFGRRERDLFVSGLMAVGLVTSLVGIAQQVIGGARLNELGYEYDTTIRTASGVLRSFSTFNQPFPFALYLMFVLVVCIPVALTDVGRRRNLLFLLSTPVLAVAMIGSIVRAALVATAAGLVFLAFHRFRVLLHGAPPTLVGLVFVPASFYVALLSASSLKERVSGWTGVASEVLGAPFGNGIGASGSASEKTAAVVEGVVASAARGGGYQPDNYYVKTIFELGPLGLWFFALLLLGAFVSALRCSRQLDGSDAALAAGIAASIVGAATASVVATYFEIFPLEVLFWISLGVLLSLPSSPSTPSPCDPVEVGSRPTPVS